MIPDGHPCELLSPDYGTLYEGDADLPYKFLGDIGQPLHCENLDVGGNDIDVTYDGDSTNLHAIWDTQIPEAIAGSSSLSGAKTWASTLTTGKLITTRRGGP